MLDPNRKIKPYKFGLRRKKIYELKKEHGEIFVFQGKTYICDGFLPAKNLDGEGIFATEIAD
jgi:hypothetical protein